MYFHSLRAYKNLPVLACLLRTRSRWYLHTPRGHTENSPNSELSFITKDICEFGEFYVQLRGEKKLFNVEKTKQKRKSSWGVWLPWLQKLNVAPSNHSPWPAGHLLSGLQHSKSWRWMSSRLFRQLSWCSHWAVCGRPAWFPFRSKKNLPSDPN